VEDDYEEDSALRTQRDNEAGEAGGLGRSFNQVDA